MCDRLEKEYFRRRSLIQTDVTSFPVVKIKGDRICKKYGLHEGVDVTEEYFKSNGISKSRLPSVRLYNIQDHSHIRTTSGTTCNDKTLSGQLPSRRGSLVLGSAFSYSNSRDPNLLEQSQAFSGLQKQISHRLGDSGNKTSKKTKPFVKEICPNTNSPTVASDNSSATLSSKQTVFRSSRETQLSASESPKEAMAKAARQPASQIVSRNSSAKHKDGIFTDSNGLVVTGVVSHKEEDENERSEISSYAIRQQYGQHLEKNWFKSLVREMKSKNKDGAPQKDYPFTPDMFYSPEPSSDEEIEDHGDYGNKQDIEIIPNTIDANNNSQQSLDDLRNFSSNEMLLHSSDDLVNLSPREGNYNLKQVSTKFASMDVLLSDGYSENDSDYEFVLKNGMLTQRRVKNKMHKQRERKHARFQQFLMNDTYFSEEEDEFKLKNMSDKELRAIRLKLKKPKWKPKLKGVARFRQIVKTICVLLYFSQKLNEAKRERRARMRRHKRHRSLCGFDGDDDNARFQRQHHHYKNLKERFLEEGGWKLVEQVATLAFRDGFGYDLQEELISGKRRSRYIRVLEELFPQEFTICNTPTIHLVKRKTIKRSTSCPELIKPKEFRVLQDVNENTRILSKKTKGKGSKSYGRNHRNYRADITESREEQDANVVGAHSLGRRNSLSMEDRNGGPLNLRDILKDIHIPAKEIKIQIAERKMRKKNKKLRGCDNVKKMVVLYDAKRAMEADRFKLPELDFDSIMPKTNIGADENNFSSVCKQACTVKVGPVINLQSFSIQNGPFDGTGVSWNQTQPEKKASWTTEELDNEIHKAGSLFLEMRHCHYIRWDRLGQAMVNRMFELENEVY